MQISWLSIDIVQCYRCRHWMTTIEKDWVCINITCDNFGKKTGEKK